MTVLTIGTFDLFHVGHLRFLESASRLGRRLTVGVNSDAFVEQYKGERPVFTYGQRADIVGALRCVCAVRFNGGPGRDLILKERPQFLVVGSDWASKDYLKQIDVEWPELELQGTQLVYLPYSDATSTTQIKNRIVASYLERHPAPTPR